MSKQLTMKEFSSKILSKPFWSLEELRLDLQISEQQLQTYLEEINEQFELVGITLDLVEINSKDYVVPLLESEEPFLTNLQLGLLTIFSFKVKMEGGSVQEQSMNTLLTNYYNDIEYLVKNNLVQVELNSVWSLTPLGASIVYPYLENSIPFIEKLTQ